MTDEERKRRHAAHVRAWQKAHPDKVKEISRAACVRYRRRHPERIRQRVRAYRQANREKVRAADRASYQKNREKRNASARRRVQQRLARDPAYREVRRLRNAVWRAKNREAWNAHQREASRRRWREEPETMRAKARDKYRRTTRAQRSYTLRRKYGITADDYDRMLAEQRGVCAVCGGSDPGHRNGYFHVDHDHETGAVRGLLCKPCNNMLGCARDNPETLIAAATYLAERSSPRATLRTVK